MTESSKSFRYEDISVEKTAGLYTLRLPENSILDFISAPALRDHFIEIAAEPGWTSVLVDMTGTDFMDATGLGLFVGALKRFRTRSDFEKLSIDTTGRPQIAKMFRITGLVHVFDLIPNEVET